MKKILFIIAVFASTLGYSQQLAFPTAKGAGAYNTGGRGGQVIHVTNLNATGAGSFIEALQTTGTRTIVFDVGGEIDITGVNLYGDFRTHINGSGGIYDNVTIAGQTAPGGIVIKSGGILVRQVDNLIIRQVAFKSGATDNDAVEFYDCVNVLLDHCDFFYGDDECVSMIGNNGDLGDNTVQHCLMTDSKTGMILGSSGARDAQNNDTVGLGDWTVVQNAFVNVSHRFPNPKGANHGQWDIFNNIVYNWQHRLVVVNPPTYLTPDIDLNVVGNAYKVPQNSEYGFSYYRENPNQIRRPQADDTEVRIYTAYNKMYGLADTDIPHVTDVAVWWNFNTSPDTENIQIDPSRPGEDYFETTQFPLKGQSFTVLTAEQAWTNVTADVGANAYLDDNHQKVSYANPPHAAHLAQAVNDTSTLGAGHNEATQIQTPHTGGTRPVGFDTDLDGMPDTWETTTFGDLTKDGTADTDSDGYTDLEEYLNLIDGAVVIVDVAGVTLDQATATINLASLETVTLVETIVPANASNQSGVWSSAHPSIATVDQNGVVTPVAVGDATITYTTNDGSFTDSAVVTVVNNVINVTGVTLDKNTETVNTLDPVQLTATVAPVDANNQLIDWSSDTPGVATVNSSGLVQPIADGVAIITAESNENNTIEDTYTITVSLPTGGTVVSIATDNAKEVIGGANDGVIYTSDPELGNDQGTSDVLDNGFLFPKPTGLPSTKTLDQVYLTFYPTNLTDNNGGVVLSITVEDALNPANFTTTNSDISNRTRVVGNVSWTPSAWDTSAAVNSPNIASLIQGVYDSGATAFNVIVEYVSGTGTRNAFGINDIDLEPSMTIIYSDGVTGNIPVTGATISVNTTSVPLNRDFTALKGVSPSNATNQGTFWTSSDESVIDINEEGNYELVGTGTAILTCNTVEGGFTASETITVTAPIIYIKRFNLLIRVIGN